MDGIVAQRYAVSFFEVAKEQNMLDEILSQLQSLEAIFGEHKELFQILSTPVITKEDKLLMLDHIFADKMQLYLLNFLKVLIEKGRMTEFFSIAKHFKKLYNQEKNIKEVIAVTAVPMSEMLLEKLKTKLTEVTHKTIVLSNEVDPRIMGGVILKMEDDQIDSSVKSRLETLGNQLSNLIA